MFQNQGNMNNGGVLGTGGPNTMDPTQQQHQQQNMNYNGMHNQIADPQTHDIKSIKGSKMKPYVKIIEQPAGKALRFRYECEGRSAGSIPGVNSTPENKTYPTIQIVGYKGRAVVVVSCVTKDSPYRPHPHNLVGKEGCKKGVCTLEINSETMRAVFSNLGIQCVKKKDIEAALKAREDIRVDPFKTGFAHRNPNEASKIDLNSVRLCFQVFMESDQRGRFTQPLAPVVSDPIYDKKAMSDLVICRLCSCSASVLGNTQIILLCEKVAKEDITVRFFEEDESGKQIWEAFGDFQHTDVHKQTAITFKTPIYRNLEITEPAKVFIQLKRPSDGVTSEKLPFEYKPLDSGRHMFCNLRRNLKRKPDEDIFQQILANDQQYKTTEAALPENQPTIEEATIPVISNSVLGPDEVAASVPVVDLVTPNQEEIPVGSPFEGQQEKLDQAEDIDMIINEMVKELEGGDFQVQQQVQDVQPLEEHHQTFANSFQANELSPTDKVTNWMNLSEMQEINEPEISDLQNVSLSPTKTEDLINQLDEIYIEHMARRDNYNNVLLTEMNGMENCVLDQTKEADGNQVTMDVDDNFDDAATYSSLQIAFKNPVEIPIEEIIQPATDNANKNPQDAQHYDQIEINSQQNSTQNQLPLIELQEEAPPRPAPPKFSSPHMHVTAAEEEKLPPLPPKRIRKQDSNAENRSIEANSCDTLERKQKQPAPIIIMKTPDQSPPTKRLPPKPGSSNSNTLPKQKKPGFFSKLFSRRKSKSDLSQTGEQQSLASSKANSKATSPNASREPSIGNFQMNDSHRASIKSLKSLQPTATQPTSPNKIFPKVKGVKPGKPVGRSVSSVSDPAHLRRKRQKTNGDPRHLLFQHQNDHNDGRFVSWNTPNIPAIKAEPRDPSPQPYVHYGGQQELAPSPQPLSPSNKYNPQSTPSPYSMSAATPGGNNQLLSPNHQTYGNGPTNGGTVPPNTAPSPMDMQEYTVFGQQANANHGGHPHQQQQYQGNIFPAAANATNWGQKSSAYNNNHTQAGNNMSNLNSTNPFTMHNLLNNSHHPSTSAGNPGSLHWNLTPNLMSQQHHLQANLPQEATNQQQYQIGNDQNVAGVASSNHSSANNENGPTISNLLGLDSEQLVRINSEDLRLNSEDLQISNLSIST